MPHHQFTRLADLAHEFLENEESFPAPFSTGLKSLDAAVQGCRAAALVVFEVCGKPDQDRLLLSLIHRLSATDRTLLVYSPRLGRHRLCSGLLRHAGSKDAWLHSTILICDSSSCSTEWIANPEVLGLQGERAPSSIVVDSPNRIVWNDPTGDSKSGVTVLLEMAQSLMRPVICVTTKERDSKSAELTVSADVLFQLAESRVLVDGAVRRMIHVLRHPSIDPLTVVLGPGEL